MQSLIMSKKLSHTLNNKIIFMMTEVQLNCLQNIMKIVIVIVSLRAFFLQQYLTIKQNSIWGYIN